MLEHRCSLPVTGSVLGIDVGWSPKRPTTGLSLIEWNQHEVRHISDVVGIDEINRRTMIRKMTDARTLLGVGIDGPLVPGLQTTNKYRTAEALLSRGKFQRRGKPGPVNGGSGPCLHRKATELAKLSLSLCDVSFATHPYSIHERAVVEAFPNAFLSVLQPEEVFSQIPKKHRPWTDVLLPYTKPIIRRLLLDVLLPRHELIFDLEGINGHEQIASFICALTALCVAAGRCVAVGDAESGYIILPPLEFWGESGDVKGKWAEVQLRDNFKKNRNARIFSNNRIL